MSRRYRFVIFGCVSILLALGAIGLALMFDGYGVFDHSNYEVVPDEGSGDLEDLENHVGQPISQLQRFFRIDLVEVSSDLEVRQRKWIFRDENNSLHELVVRDGKLVGILEHSNENGQEIIPMESFLDRVRKGDLKIDAEESLEQSLRSDGSSNQD